LNPSMFPGLDKGLEIKSDSVIMLRKDVACPKCGEIIGEPELVVILMRLLK